MYAGNINRYFLKIYEKRFIKDLVKTQTPSKPPVAPDPTLIEKLRQDILKELDTIRIILATKYSKNPSKCARLLNKIQYRANYVLTNYRPELLFKENYVNMLQWYSNYYSTVIQKLNGSKIKEYIGSANRFSAVA